MKGGINLNRHVAIDGPAGSGKSTVARIVGKRLNLTYIDSGAMYRAVTLEALNRGIPHTDEEAVVKMVKSLDMNFDGDKMIVNGIDVSEDIRTTKVSNSVSSYAAIADVRHVLVEKMQDISEKCDVVMEGRDICTVVLKDASNKFFLSADAEERAQRRYKEYQDKNIEVDYDKLLQSIKERDEKDSTRKADPLKKAEDAIEINSTGLTIEQVVDKIVSYVK